MSRVTEKTLRFKVTTLNMLLERPMDQFSSVIGEPTKFSVGHISLSRDGYGWLLEEQCSESGGVHTLESGLRAGEMNLFISGLIRGIGLRNAHIGELMLRNELVKAGLTTSDATLYNQNTHNLSHEQLKAKQAEHEEAGLRAAAMLPK